jgi:hypothetical protein
LFSWSHTLQQYSVVFFELHDITNTNIGFANLIIKNGQN